MTEPTLKSPVRIYAVDPGISVLGWAVISHDVATGISTVTHRGVLTGQRLLKERKDMQDRYSKSFIILDVYYSLFCQMIDTYKVHYVVSEGAFYYRFPQAYASLTLVIHTLRRACRDRLGSDLYQIAPMETKKTITTKSMADKDLMKSALLSRPNLVIISSDDAPLETCTEHEFDAIGHGLTFITRDLPRLLADTDKK